jgi:hypothetical protein
MGGLCQRRVTSGEGWSAQGNVAVDGALTAGSQQIDATALAQAARRHQRLEAGFAQQATHADGLRRAAADAVEQHDLARVLARIGAQTLQQFLVVAGNDLFGNLRRQQAGIGLDLHLGVGGQGGEQSCADQDEA